MLELEKFLIAEIERESEQKSSDRARYFNKLQSRAMWFIARNKRTKRSNRARSVHERESKRADESECGDNAAESHRIYFQFSFWMNSWLQLIHFSSENITSDCAPSTFLWHFNQMRWTNHTYCVKCFAFIAVKYKFALSNFAGVRPLNGDRAELIASQRCVSVCIYSE